MDGEKAEGELHGGGGDGHGNPPVCPFPRNSVGIRGERPSDGVHDAGGGRGMDPLRRGGAHRRRGVGGDGSFGTSDTGAGEWRPGGGHCDRKEENRGDIHGPVLPGRIFAESVGD